VNVAADALLWCSGALDLLVLGRALLRRRRRSSRRRSPRVPAAAGRTRSTTPPAPLYLGMYSGLGESEAEVMAELGAKLHQARERIAEFERAQSLVEPGIREVEAYLRRAAGHDRDGGA